MPARSHIVEATSADPLRFYYLPLAASFYRGRLKDAVRMLPGRVGRLLDFGCGAGVFLPELSHWCDELLACDVHKNLDRVERMLAAEGIRARLDHVDGKGLPYEDASLDGIMAMSVLEHIRDLGPIAEEFHRVVRPGGWVIAGVPKSNVLSDAMLRASYVVHEAKLDDEHVSTDRDVAGALGRRFTLRRRLQIPRLVPGCLQMYTTLLFEKTDQDRDNR